MKKSKAEDFRKAAPAMPDLQKATRNASILLLGVAFLQGCASLNSEFEYRKGAELFKNQQYQPAHAYALDAHQQSPDNLKYTALLGWTWLKQGNVQEAEPLFSSILQSKPDDISGLQGMAWVDYSKKEFQKAQSLFEKDITWAEHHTHSETWNFYAADDQLYVRSILSDSYYGLGLIDIARQRYDASIGDLEKSLRYPNSFIGASPVKAALADALYLQKDYRRAGKISLDLLKDDLNTPYVLNRLLWSIQMSGDALGAEEILAAGIKDAHDRRPFLFGMVVVSQLQNDREKRDASLSELIRLDPEYVVRAVPENVKNPAAWKELIAGYAKPLGESSYAHGDFYDALQYTNTYLRRFPHDSQSLLTAAWCRLYLGQYQDALREFTLLSRQADCPKDQALTGKGVALLSLGRLDEADRVFNDVVQKYPDNVRARLDRGAVAYWKGDYQEAIRIYTANLNLLPEKDSFFSWPSYALNNLGWSYYYTGDYAKALEIFQKLETYHPQPVYPVIYNGLGWSYLKLNRLAEARQAFRQSLSLDGKNWSALAGAAKLSTME
jgi:tetratricopeptide (TPR) repeat protein